MISAIRPRVKVIKWAEDLLTKKDEQKDSYTASKKTQLKKEQTELLKQKKVLRQKLTKGIFSDAEYLEDKAEIEGRLNKVSEELEELEPKNNGNSKHLIETLKKLELVLNEVVSNGNVQKRAELAKIMANKIDLKEKEPLNVSIHWGFPFRELYEMGKNPEFFKKKVREA
jgi:hypothetical protein